jgi:hypothetical protein
VRIGPLFRFAPAQVGRAVPDAKMRECEGLVAKSLSMGIVQIVVMSIADRAGVFSLKRHRTRGLPAMGRLAGPLLCGCGPR